MNIKKSLLVILGLLAYSLLFTAKLGATDAQNTRFLVQVSFSEIQISLIDLEQDGVVAQYPVALPAPWIRMPFPVEGEIKKIIRNPTWYPTLGTRRAYLHKHGIGLPERLAPSDPRNAMGLLKIQIDYHTPGINPLILIHGTNDAQSIGQRISRGCIRMHNHDGVALADIIEGNRVAIRYIE